MNKQETEENILPQNRGREFSGPMLHILSNMRSGGDPMPEQYPPGDIDELIFADEEYQESEK